jgi:hypothetical protein
MENSLLDDLEKVKDEQSAMKVGIIPLLRSNLTIEKKRNLFEQALGVKQY